MINDAEIVAGDLFASGVAHGISTVLAVPSEIRKPEGS